MQCKDKFLIQSTKVPPSIDIDEIPPDTVRMIVLIGDYFYYFVNVFVMFFCGLLQFVKDEQKVIEELKLRVVYVTPQSHDVSSGGDSGITSAAKLSMRGSDVRFFLKFLSSI